MSSRAALPTAPLPAASAHALPAGTQLDDCEIEQVLSQSSFGVVYRAYDHALKLHVAIKEYLPDALALRSAEAQVVPRSRAHAQRFETGREAFIGEAQTLARCEHPGLLRISRLLLRHGTAYRVMRYCPGPTLLEHRRSLAEAPDEATLRAWLDALLGALAALHDEGCVHGAVSPGNIVLVAGERPVLLDFDAVRAALISDRTQGLMAALEPCFAPIEQRSPSPYRPSGPWTDLYALAATMHFCIGGVLPAPSAGTAPAARFEPLAAVWQRLRAREPGRQPAPALLAALDACLAEAPQDRPQSVAQLLELLGAPGRGRPALAAVNPPPEAGSDGVAAPVSAPRSALTSEPASAPTSTLTSTLTSAPSSTHIAAPTAAPIAASEPPPRRASPPEPARRDAAPGAREQSAVDAAHAKVIAELDQTFALIAAQANEDALAAPAAAAAPAPVAESPAAPVTLLHRRLWLSGAALAAITAILAGGWLLSQRDGGTGPVGGAVTEAASQVAAAAAPALDFPPTAAGTRDAGAAPKHAAAAAPAPTPGLPPTDGGTRDAAPAPTNGAIEPPAASRRAEETPPPAVVAQAAVPAPASPRALCGKRDGYALYQCMQTQCAKRILAKHPQCLRLKQNQSLG